MKSHGLFVNYSPPNFISTSIKAFSFLCCVGLSCVSPWLQTLNCNSLLISDKPILAGEISGSLFVLGQHFDVPYRDKTRHPKGPRAGE